MKLNWINGVTTSIDIDVEDFTLPSICDVIELSYADLVQAEGCEDIDVDTYQVVVNPVYTTVIFMFNSGDMWCVTGLTCDWVNDNDWVVNNDYRLS